MLQLTLLPLCLCCGKLMLFLSLLRTSHGEAHSQRSRGDVVGRARSHFHRIEVQALKPIAIDAAIDAATFMFMLR